MEIPAVIEQVLIDNGIVLHIVSKTAKYIAPNSAHGATAAIPQNGVDPHQAAKILHDLVVQARNIVGGRGGLPNAVDALRDDYLNWAETIEIQLLGLTSDSAIVAMLHIDRYWQIRALDETMIRPLPLVDAEIRLQTARLERLANDLSERATRLSSAGGHLTVLDINILLHYLPPAQIPWGDVVGQPSVRLVVPLRVIEELDAKKYGKRVHLAERARSVLPALEAVLGHAGSPGGQGRRAMRRLVASMGSRRGEQPACGEVGAPRANRRWYGPTICLDIAARLMQRRVIAIVHAPARPAGAALGDQPAVTQLGVELPRIGDAPLAICGFEESAFDLAPVVSHRHSR